MTGLLIETLHQEVRIAYDGQQAIDLAQEFRPELVLMDLGMPGINGYEAARRIREQPRGAAAMFVALTGWGQEEDRKRTQEAGFAHHLVKPATRSDLQQLLAELEEKK